MRTPTWTCFALALFAVAGCGDDKGVNSQKDAENAYLGLDHSIDKAIDLGFAGYNSAMSANISPQMGTGTKSGTITVTGKVDQGASNNKTMNLNVAMAMYSDDGNITYDTDAMGGTDAATLPALDMHLNKVPTGTLDGSLAGPFGMSGALKGTVTLMLTFNGNLEPDPMDMTKVRRKVGTTHITGTAVSPAGTYMVDITR